MNLKAKMAVTLGGLSLILTACAGPSSFTGTVNCDATDSNGVTTCRATQAPTASQAPSTTATPTQTVTPTPTQTVTPSPTVTATPTPSQTTTPPASTEVRKQAYTTGYGWWDNTPAGSSDISHPVIHTKAGGDGSYSNPVTIAVGHSIINGKDVLDYPAGTKMYIPNLQKYFIVEDTCGDGNTPQNGPCHQGYPAGTTTWVDVWIGGQSATHTQSDNCEGKLTDANGEAHLLIINPDHRYRVVSGDILLNGVCRANYGNTPIMNAQ
jgi:hypothetical protein